jgi:hypothetical protein
MIHATACVPFAGTGTGAEENHEYVPFREDRLRFDHRPADYWPRIARISLDQHEPVQFFLSQPCAVLVTQPWIWKRVMVRFILSFGIVIPVILAAVSVLRSMSRSSALDRK